MWKPRGWFRSQEACSFVCLFCCIKKGRGEQFLTDIKELYYNFIQNKSEKTYLLCFCFSNENEKGREYSTVC